MASRPIFIPVTSGSPGVQTRNVQFKWSPGLSLQQQQKNVDALHSAALAQTPQLCKPLEISRKSRTELGIRLSAFNLGTFSDKSQGFVCVESLYQASKVFPTGGPFPELYSRPPREVREVIRRYESERLVAFDLHGVRWPLVPQQAFYTWVYLHALRQNPDLANAINAYDSFTDIAFNPQRSINCQAFAVAFFVSLNHFDILRPALASPSTFLEVFTSAADAPSPVITTKRTTKQRKPKRLKADSDPERPLLDLH